MDEEKKELAVEKVETPKTISEIFTSDYVRAAIAKSAPRHLDVDRFLRIANTATAKVPQLRNCTVTSFWNCLIQLSSLGLEPNGRDAHLIPFGKECTLIVDYKGIVLNVRRSGEVSDIQAVIVCENDTFEWEKGRVTKHVVDWRKPRGEMFAVYSYVKLKDGTESYETMSKEEIEAIHQRSKAKNSGPWVTDYNEMAKKTAFRRHSKWLPFSTEIRNVIEADDRTLFPEIAETITEDDIRKIPDGTRLKIRKKDQLPVQEAEPEQLGDAQEPVEDEDASEPVEKENDISALVIKISKLYSKLEKAEGQINADMTLWDASKFTGVDGKEIGFRNLRELMKYVDSSSTEKKKLGWLGATYGKLKEMVGNEKTKNA